jgi:hypothetical protein
MKPLTASELEALHSVLRRAAERAERNRDTRLAMKLAVELAVIEYEMRVG